MKELYKKNKNKIKICVVILIILILLWLIIIGPFIKFKQNEKTVLEAAKRYYEINNAALPTGKRIATVTLQKLYDKDLISTDLTSSYTSKMCDSKKSWVKVRKENNEYKYYTYLKCGIYSSNIDHEGPVINLKGNDSITINKGDSWTDPGISSVIDNTDGNIDPKEVKVKSNVNTNKNGTYTITYTVRDNFKNETVKKRTVKVVQILDQIVKKDTKKTNGYYKATATNNYVNVDGITFKIIGVSDEGIVKIVSDEELSYVDKNSIDEWLNDYFYNKLSDNAKKYIVPSKYCIESNLTTGKCKKYSKKKNVGLLTIEDTIKTEQDGEKLYVNALSAPLLLQDGYYIDNNSKYNKTKNKIYPIRAVMSIDKNITIKSGDGTSMKPYILSGYKNRKPDDKVSDTVIGEYIEYSGYTWRVSGYEDGKTQVVMLDNVLQEDDNEVVTNFDDKKNYYNNTGKANLGYKIQNVYSTLISSKLFEKTEYTIYKYNGMPKFINNEKKYTIKTKLIEISMFDLFSGSSAYSFWYRESNDKYGYSKGGAYVDYTEKESIKLTGYLKESTKIKKGKGKYNDPYRITE